MNVARSTLVTAAILFVAVTATGGAFAADPVTLTVSVTDRDGDAVAGATVEATWETDAGETGTASGTTASNGNVLLDVPEGAGVELDVDDDAYVRNRPLRVENASETTVDLGVSRSGTATVTVVDGENRSQPDATVRVREGGRTIDRGETEADGRYETARLERGDYEVVVVKPGYLEASVPVTVGDGGEARVAVERGATTLDVRVFDDHFDPPVPIETGAVRASSSVFDGRVSVTDGTASLTVPVNAVYTVAVVKNGYDATSERVRVEESAVSVNATAQRSAALVAEPANDRVLVGETTRVTVRNAYDEPVGGATVELDGEAVGETDDRGEFEVTIRTAGDRTLVARDGDTVSEPVTVVGVDESATDRDDGSADDADGDASDGDSSSDDGTTDDENPGFGVVAAAVALLALSVAGRTRGR
jgi:hypothetical protein